MKKKICLICMISVLVVSAAVLFYNKTSRKNDIPMLESISTEDTCNLVRKEFSDTLGLAEDANPLTKLIYDHFSIKVTSITGTEAAGEIHCIVSNRNVSDILTNIFSFSEEYTIETYTAALSAAFNNSPICSKELTISIHKENEIFTIELTDEQFDACSGGLLSYYETLMEK